MSNRFLAWYNEELAALRRRAAGFAERHPKIAQRLRMSGDSTDDPHAERILQGFAYTAARIRQKLDDDFPELTDTLLDAFYPQYLAQIPSMTIMQMTPAADMGEVQAIEAGFAVQTEEVRRDRCRYVTTQDVEMAPLRVADCTLSNPPFSAPHAPDLSPQSCLSITLECINPAVPPADLALDGLTFFVRSAFPTAAALFELVMNRAVGIAVAAHADDDRAVRLPVSALRPVGFAEAAAMLPFPQRGFPGFRLLAEFFALPEKFLFFRADGLAAALSRMPGSGFTLFIYLSEPAGALAKTVNGDVLALNCTPVINLFEQRAEPIQVTRARHEYEIIPDARRNDTREVHSISEVVISDGSGNRQVVQPFFGRKRGSVEDRATMFWQHKRILDEDSKAFTSRLALIDRALNAATPDGQAVASVTTRCINRDLPEMLPFGGGQPYLTALGQTDNVRSMAFVMPPTPTARFADEDGSYWRLISHLSLNHLPLTGDNPEFLRDLLRLYNVRETQEGRVMIDAIAGLESRRSTARLADGSIVNGTDVTITFDDALLDRGQAYLLACVLSHFLGLYASINTFCRLTVKMANVALPLARFEPRTAGDVLL